MFLLPIFVLFKKKMIILYHVSLPVFLYVYYKLGQVHNYVVMLGFLQISKKFGKKKNSSNIKINDIHSFILHVLFH